MNVFFMEEEPISLVFFKVVVDPDNDNDCKGMYGEHYKAGLDLILQDKTLLTTGTQGVIHEKQFPWKILMSGSPKDVFDRFNIHLTFIALKPREGHGGPRLRIKMNGDFLPMLKHVFGQVPPTPRVNLNIGFDFDEPSGKKTPPFHVLVSGTAEGNFKLDEPINNIFLHKIIESNGKTTLAKLTIELFDKSWIPPCLLPEVSIHDDIRTREFNRKLLEGKILTDFTLVAADEEFEIPCHKAILHAASRFFEVMFQANCKEMIENRCTLGLSPEGLTAFLEFIYFSGVEKPLQNLRIAKELLEISHALDMPELEDKMKQVLIGKTEKELDLDAALRLFVRCMSLDLDGYDGVKEKAISVIKMKKNELKNSTLFDQLMESDPGFAKEFLSFFI